MAARLFAKVVGAVLAVLAVGGFFVEGELLFDFMNVDIAIDVIRLLLAVLLIWVGFGRTSRKALNAVLALLGGSYLVLGVLGLFDREVFGLLPTGLTGFDLVFHIVVGLAAIAFMMVPGQAADKNTRDGRPVA